MSKEGASVAVGVFFNIAVAVAPNVSDEHKRIAFFCTVPLLILAILWWLWAHFKTPKTKPEVPRAILSAGDITNSTIATAARDVHQTIYHHSPPLAPEVKLELPDFYYHGAGSIITLRPLIPPGKSYSVAVIQCRLEFTNGGQATAYNLTAETYGCWIHDEPPRAMLIDVAKSVGRTPPNQGKSIEFLAEREWDSRTGFHSLNIRKNQLTILVEISFRVGSSDGPIYANEPIWLTWTPEVRDRMTDATEADVAIASRLIGGLKARGDKSRQPEPTAKQATRTKIEEIDNLLLTYNALRPVFGGVNHGAPYLHLEKVIANTTDFLRKNLSDYVDKFNEAVNDPHPFKEIPPDMDDATLEEWSKIDGQKRRQGWDTILSATAYLERLRNELYAKLP
jgi:hypothetical protein